MIWIWRVRREDSDSAEDYVMVTDKLDTEWCSSNWTFILHQGRNLKIGKGRTYSVKEKLKSREGEEIGNIHFLSVSSGLQAQMKYVQTQMKYMSWKDLKIKYHRNYQFSIGLHFVGYIMEMNRKQIMNKYPDFLKDKQ